MFSIISHLVDLVNHTPTKFTNMPRRSTGRKRGDILAFIPKERRKAKFKVTEENDGSVYTFFCDLSGAIFWKTKPIRADTPEAEYEIAWNEAKRNVNSCHKCGRNVIDALYNVETMECVKCSPWQKPPVYCADCGARLSETDSYCKVCGKKIQEEGVDEDADS